ncbi:MULTISPECIES: amino acid ABC transporter ATP-binding protein [unclassified Gordonia (in: high G+C Gram-positive bacteria)]|uniref:amino acid ABC transporter ATP-binding protein n=1 Tax=unclassified Gordonia (in: high G+C Gram-positive bacteria) TaxID=2657482 RepID=UPI00200009B0|nr:MULTISPECIES: amino acid ABC transporter ATP-binding protein [unclassified Gordonia (in: high G+C Gram-positive bacteria)]UQE74133.1 amino acid ABC transporter ATP-binding protein [Gordonia sp. PP30]
MSSPTPANAPEPETTEVIPLAAPSPVSLTGTGLHLAFGDNQVLRGVDIHVDAGTTTTVIGPSGSGKSTLLRVLNRLHEPQAGDILIDGRSVLHDNPDELRRRIGMVFQQFNLFPHMTVAENISLAPRKLRKLGKDEARDLALAQLDAVGLKEKADVRPSTLSGGQQQRVAIARALAMKPEIMFFDEATSALDPELVKGVLALMTELSREGMTMVVVTHEMGYARNVSDNVLFMDGGVVVETGSPEQLFDAPSSERLQTFLSEVL